MKVILSSILVWLYSTDGSHSFSPSRVPRHHRTYSTRQKTPSRINYSPYSDDTFLNNDSPYLHYISTIRGGASSNGAYNSNNSSNNNNNSQQQQQQQYGSLNSLSVSELKRILNDRSIDYRDCLEKRDLIERILSSPPSSSSTSFYGTSFADTSSLSQEENRVVNTFTRASPSVAYIQTLNTAVMRRGRNGFELKGTEVPVGAGSGFLWDDRVSTSVFVSLVFFLCCSTTILKDYL